MHWCLSAMYDNGVKPSITKSAAAKPLNEKFKDAFVEVMLGSGHAKHKHCRPERVLSMAAIRSLDTNQTSMPVSNTSQTLITGLKEVFELVSDMFISHVRYLI